MTSKAIVRHNMGLKCTTAVLSLFATCALGFVAQEVAAVSPGASKNQGERRDSSTERSAKAVSQAIPVETYTVTIGEIDEVMGQDAQGRNIWGPSVQPEGEVETYTVTTGQLFDVIRLADGTTFARPASQASPVETYAVTIGEIDEVTGQDAQGRNIWGPSVQPEGEVETYAVTTGQVFDVIVRADGTTFARNPKGEKFEIRAVAGEDTNAYTEDGAAVSVAGVTRGCQFRQTCDSDGNNCSLSCSGKCPTTVVAEGVRTPLPDTTEESTNPVTSGPEPSTTGQVCATVSRPKTGGGTETTCECVPN